MTQHTVSGFFQSHVAFLARLILVPCTLLGVAVLWCDHSDQGLFKLFQKNFKVALYIEDMRTTHPEIQRIDNLTIGAGPTECSQFYQRPHQASVASQNDSAHESNEQIQDSVSLSAESFQTEEAASGLCANLLAAWG